MENTVVSGQDIRGNILILLDYDSFFTLNIKKVRLISWIPFLCLVMWWWPESNVKCDKLTIYILSWITASPLDEGPGLVVDNNKTMGKYLLVCDNCIDYGWIHFVGEAHVDGRGVGGWPCDQVVVTVLVWVWVILLWLSTTNIREYTILRVFLLLILATCRLFRNPEKSLSTWYSQIMSRLCEGRVYHVIHNSWKFFSLSASF